MFDIISIGDATIDTLVELRDAKINCEISKDQCMFCINYADKIPVYKINRVVAGNAANAAIGSSRLGLKSAFCTIVGDDDNGDWILKKIKNDGVSIKYSRKEKKGETNASTVINFKGERTILVYHAPKKYKLPKMDGTKWVYYTSIGKGHAKYNNEVINFVKKRKARLAYNPGTFQLQTKLKGMKKVIAASHVMFVNKEEAARIVGAQHNIRRYLLALRKLGPEIIVITDGKNGSSAFNGKEFYEMGLIPGKAIERTGAGDAYGTAFMAALAYGKSVPEAMCWGATNATSVISKIGPQEGLLTLQQIKRNHRKKRHTCATTF